MTSADSKVLFRVENQDGSVDTETLWATSLGEEIYRLENSPFYAYGVSWLDEVYAPLDPNEGLPTFNKVVRASGHKTLRIILDPPAEEGNSSTEILNKVNEYGATYEGANKSYIALDIPVDGDFLGLCEFLTSAEVQWEHGNPTYAELYPGDP